MNEQIESSLELGFLDRGERLFLHGRSGVEMPHSVTRPAIAASEADRCVYHGTIARLIESLAEAMSAHNLSRRPAQLLFDDIGHCRL